MQELLEIEAIKRLKYRYFRCLDRKEWEGLRDCFSADASARYDSGRFSFEGREEIMRFLENALGRPTLLTQHHGHHPEIELLSGDRARGVWYLEDYVIDTERNTALHGAAFYTDEYVKSDGGWKLRATGYERTYEEVFDRSETPSLRITRSLFAAA